MLDTGSIAKVRHLLNESRFHYIHDLIFNLESIDTLVARADLISSPRCRRRVSTTSAIPTKPQRQRQRHAECAEGRIQAWEKGRFQLTSEVYGRNPKVPWNENDDRVLGATTIERWCYSTSKAVGEHSASPTTICDCRDFRSLLQRLWAEA